MFKLGEFPEELSNPWARETDANAPFNQEFFLVFNVAIGGNAGYFKDG